MMFSWWADEYPQIFDAGLYLLVCIPALIVTSGPLRACAATLLLNFFVVAGYEQLTGGYAVLDNIYMVSDVACAVILSLVLIAYGEHERTSVPALLILLGFWFTVMIDSLKLMGIAPVTCWWAVRAINYAQLLMIGGLCVAGGGKRNRGAIAVLHRVFGNYGTAPIHNRQTDR